MTKPPSPLLRSTSHLMASALGFYLSLDVSSPVPLPLLRSP